MIRWADRLKSDNGSYTPRPARNKHATALQSVDHDLNAWLCLGDFVSVSSAREVDRLRTFGERVGTRFATLVSYPAGLKSEMRGGGIVDGRNEEKRRQEK